MNKQKYRIIILGAGFSKPAGLPLADELWREILARSRSLSGRASKFNDDLDKYISYRWNCDGIELTRETIDFEEFLGFLDIEHYLGLRGSDTWSKDGNEGQIVVKTLIGEILSKYIPSPKQADGVRSCSVHVAMATGACFQSELFSPEMIFSLRTFRWM